MQITFTPSRGDNGGYALIITMIFLTVCLVIFGSMMMWVSTNSKINQRNNQFNMSQAAAEAATERVLAPMERDFLSQSLATNANTYAMLDPMETNFDSTPWPVQYIFSDATGTTGQISVLHGLPQSVLQPVGLYANLKGFPWYWTNIATATPVGQPYTVSATVTQVVNFSSIPIFQYAIFYNINLEISPGKPMFINGPVWSNQGLWAGNGNLTFNSTVSAVKQADVSGTDPFALNYTSSTPPPAQFNPGQPTSGNTSLTMPIAGATNSNPTNVEAILNIPPVAYALGSANAYTTNGLQYLANGAGLIISNSLSGTNVLGGGYTPTGTNITIFLQDGANPAMYLQPLTPDFYRLKTPISGTIYYTNYVWPASATTRTNRCATNVAYAGWSFVTNVAFYDYRESAVVQAVQIDVAQFNIWVTNLVATNGGGQYISQYTNDTGHSIDSIWVYNKVNFDSTTLPAVRVKNGIQLANSWGFTVVTPMPIYVYGDYNKQQSPALVSSGTNTANTYPAALMGDAVTILSTNWSDTYSAVLSLGSRTGASDTTVNAACLEGIVQSVPSISGNYSGGVENFIRYLEDWTGNVNTYNGSIVVMFPSIYATNSWQPTGIYYNPPTRVWGFDFNFTQQSKLPPLTPQLKKTARVSWDAK